MRTRDDCIAREHTRLCAVCAMFVRCLCAVCALFVRCLCAVCALFVRMMNWPAPRCKIKMMKNRAFIMGKKKKPPNKTYVF